MTWNLWWRFGPWQARQGAIEEVLRDETPDVVMLQEVWSEGADSAAHRLGAALGYEVAITDDPFASATNPPRPVGFHNAILSRWPLERVTNHALPKRGGEPGHRRALSAVVAAPSGRWPVVCAHLDHRFDDSATRQVQCEALLRIVAGVRNDPDSEPPTIVGADCNAVPDADEIRLLTGRRAAPVDNLVLGDVWEQCGDGPGLTWRADNPYRAHTAWPNRRLDYLFVSWPRPKPLGNPTRSWLAGLGPVDGIWPSDHAAVLADLVSS